MRKTQNDAFAGMEQRRPIASGMRTRPVLLAAHLPLLVVLASLSACGKSCGELTLAPPPPLKMTAIEIGTDVDDQNRVTSQTRTFAPQSTVYISIKTEGAGEGTLVVEWAVGTPGTIVSTEKREIHPNDTSYFAFGFVPAEGWPHGTNRVRFVLDHGQADPEKHIAEFHVQ